MGGEGIKIFVLSKHTFNIKIAPEPILFYTKILKENTFHIFLSIYASDHHRPKIVSILSKLGHNYHD